MSNQQAIVNDFPGGTRPAEDPTARKAARALRDKLWDPRHHIYRYMPGDEADMLAAFQANNGLEFFVNLPNPADPTLCNCPQAGQVECTYDLDGVGLFIGGDLVVPPGDTEVALSFRRALLEHSSAMVSVRDNNIIVDDIKGMLLTPGPDVSGSVSTTETNMIRDRTTHGTGGRFNYYRTGGPDPRIVTELERGEQWVARLRVSTDFLTILNTMLGGEQPDTAIPKGGIHIGFYLFGWAYKKYF